MPLSAYLYSQKIVAPLLNENEWGHIKASLKQNPEYLHFKCCSSPVYARVSKKGLKHFVHKNTDHCNYVGESEDHLLLKMEIYNACRELGWDAELEYSGDNFRADVLASNGKHKVAFEIQLTRQDLKTTIERQKIFDKAGIRCAWFFKRIPKDYRPRKYLPAFELEIDKNNALLPYNCNISGGKIPLQRCVEMLLEGNIQFRKKLSYRKKQKAKIYLFDENCWKCGFQYKAVGAWSVLESKCGSGTINADFGIEDLGIKTKSLVDSFKDIYPNMAIFNKSYSKTTRSYYWANSCPQCKVSLGQYFLTNRIIEILANDTVPETEITYKIDNTNDLEPVEFPHWCVKGPEGFCDN